MQRKKIISLLFLVFIFSLSYSQKREYSYETSLLVNASSASSMPFWLISNKNGIIPNSNSSILQLKLNSDYAGKKKIDFSYGVNFIASQAKKREFILSELYIGAKWKVFYANIGMKNPEQKYSGITVSNDDLLMSGNARSYPELVLGIPEYLNVNSWFAFKGVFANGILIDDRYVDKANVHHKNLFLRFGKTQGLSFEMGLDHYVQWGGTSPQWGSLGGFDSFIQGVCLMSGKTLVDKHGNSSINESLNKSGNHLGQNTFKLNYNTDNYFVGFSLKNIYEDKSGFITRANRIDDWNASIRVDLKKNKIVSSFIYQYFYTKDQGGYSIRTKEEHPNEPIIGFDQYFNNSIFASGWTNYGRIMGIPTLYRDNNAVVLHHIGICGQIAKVKYKFIASFTENNGRPVNPSLGVPYSKHYTFAKSLYQQSYLLSLDFPRINKIPFDISASIALDNGEYLKDNIGFNLKLTKKDIF